MVGMLSPEQLAHWNDIAKNMAQHAAAYRKKMLGLLAEKGRAALESELHTLEGTLDLMMQGQFDYMLVERDWTIKKISILKDILRLDSEN